MGLQIPENCVIVESHKPQTLASVGTGDYISCKNAKRVFVVFHLAYGADDDITMTLYEATTVAAGSAAAITATMPIWECADPATSDAFTRKTDAATFDVDTGSGKDRIAIMQWDPAKFSDGFDCLALNLSNSSASNVGHAYFVIEPAYAEDAVPSFITD